VLGTGAVAGRFAEDLALVEGARLQAVASRAYARAEGFAARFRVPRAYESYERLVHDGEVDVVYVATPNDLHAEHCLIVIEAGKAVLCEKPFALNASEGRAIIECARRRGVFCMEAMWMRFSPALREVLELAREGAIGELRLLSAELGFSHKPDLCSRLFSRPGGGALLDLGVYPLSLAQALFGRPTRVASLATVHASGVDEQFGAVLEYPGGRQAIVAASVRSQLANAAAIHGTGGILQVAAPLYFPHRYRLVRVPTNRPMRRASRGAMARIRQQKWLRSLAEVRRLLRAGGVTRRAPGNGYASEAAEVVRCLRGGLLESPKMTLDDTLAVLESMDAIRQQWLQGS